ncbi:MAG: TolC family protein [Deltaproteobacteria bacterium]|nr:TolC family protein [Deltaproteobacteria bacterium]
MSVPSIVALSNARRLRLLGSLVPLVLFVSLLPVAASAALAAAAPDADADADADEALPDPLRLQDVLQRARDHRAEILAARARARAVAERPAIVSSLEDPMVSPSVDHLPFALHGADVSLVVEQRFPLSGLNQDRRRGAEAEAERVAAEADRVVLDVELDAARAFLMVHERRRRAELLEEQLALPRLLIVTATARYAGGAGAQPDVLRAEVEVARLEGAARALRSDVLAAEAMLNTSLARRADAAVPPLASPMMAAAPAAWREVRAAALGKSPELSAGRAEIRAAEADVQTMGAMGWPMGMVRTGPAYTMSDGPGWMLMVGVSVPLWRGRVDASVREAEAMVAMARADLSVMTRMVEGEAATARLQLLASRDRFLTLRDDVIPRTRRVIDPTIAAYASGTLPLVSVIDAAQTLWLAEADLISAELELGLAWLRLNRAMGSGGEARP